MSHEFKCSELVKKINSFEERGFMFLQKWTIDKPYVPDRYKLPCGDILTEKELLDFFKIRKSELGNKRHIEIREAQYYYYLINSELFDEERIQYSSFLNNEDEENCRKKYEN